MSLLVITRFSPLNGTSGAGTYLFSVLRYLHERGIKTHVCWSEGPGPEGARGWCVIPKEFARIATLHVPRAITLGRLVILPHVFLNPIRAAIRQALKKALSVLGLRKQRPADLAADAGGDALETAAPLYAWDRPPDLCEHAFFQREIARLNPKALLFYFCWMTPVIDGLADPARYFKITFSNDLRHLYSTLVEGTIRQTEGDFMSKELEVGYLRTSDLVVAIRESDAEVFRGLLPGKELLVVHPSFDAAPPSGEPLPHRCLFVGSDSSANREGLLWFLQDAWRLIRAADPQAELHICGPICKSLKLDTPGVVLRGFVDDLQATYGEASVVIVPLLCGSGVKIKLMEALAHGKACVTTPIGTEGVPALDGCVLTAPDAAAFARDVLSVLQDASLRRGLEARALATIANHFSPDACYGPLYERLGKAGAED